MKKIILKSYKKEVNLKKIIIKKQKKFKNIENIFKEYIN